MSSDLYPYCQYSAKFLKNISILWFQLLEKGKEIGAVFFNFYKAFDTVPHQPLVDKPCQLGLNSQIVKWVHNYLADREQRVVVTVCPPCQ